MPVMPREFFIVVDVVKCFIFINLIIFLFYNWIVRGGDLNLDVSLKNTKRYCRTD